MSADREETCQLFNQEIFLLSRLAERLPMIRYEESNFGNPEDNLIIYNEDNSYAKVNIQVMNYGWVKEDKLLHIDKIRYDIKLLDADSLRIEDKYLHFWEQKPYKEYEGYRRDYTIDEAVDLIERFLTTVPLYGYDKLINIIRKITDDEIIQKLLTVYFYKTGLELEELEVTKIKEPSDDFKKFHGEGYILDINGRNFFMSMSLIKNHYNQINYPIISLN